ncbi:MAG: hypothetical protein AAF656_02320 [Planctomycetota bacterium]
MKGEEGGGASGDGGADSGSGTGCGCNGDGGADENFVGNGGTGGGGGGGRLACRAVAKYDGCCDGGIEIRQPLGRSITPEIELASVAQQRKNPHGTASGVSDNRLLWQFGKLLLGRRILLLNCPEFIRRYEPLCVACFFRLIGHGLPPVCALVDGNG